MPEATTLYSVTGVVIVGLVAWVAMVLKQAKEPWARPAPAEEPADDLEAPESKKADADAKDEAADAAAETKTDGAKLDADDTARATPVALSEGRQKVADEKPVQSTETPEEEKKDEAKEEEA